MISFDEAQSLVRTHAWQAKPETRFIADTIGRAVYDDIVSSFPSPAFNNSAVDGYAVGSINEPHWNLVGAVVAGETADFSIQNQEAMRVFTGAKTPNGTAGVVMQEDAAVADGRLTSLAPVLNLAHIRRKGEDFEAGTIVVPSGTRIHPGNIAELAALGYSEVKVNSLPRVAVLATGDELITPGQFLLSGQVFESNSVAIQAMLRMFGIEPTMSRAIDDLQATESIVGSLLETHDLILTIGGVSVGERDFIPAAVKSAGIETIFSKVAVKPGKPISFGISRDKHAWFGLPGNPMSSAVTFLLFVLPYLGIELEVLHLHVSGLIDEGGNREFFVPGKLDFSDGPKIALQPKVGSHSVVGFAYCDGLVRIPVGQYNLYDKFEFRFFPWRNLP